MQVGLKNNFQIGVFMKIKRIIAFILLVVTLFTLSGCLTIFEKKVTIDCVTYETNGRGGYSILKISTSGTDDAPERIYVRDEIDGKPVVSGVGYYDLTHINAENSDRVYIPWTFKGANIQYVSPARGKKMVKYIIHPSYDYYIFPYDGTAYSITFVLPKLVYDAGNYSETSIIPANIAYFFNYTDSPNGGYFFVDIEEQTGKIIKPPYDPKREGYAFTGWYKDAECTQKWNFNEDNVVVNYDEEGNRIFEELCLYAGWSKNN